MSLKRLNNQIEARIVKALVHEMIVRGYLVSVDNGGDEYEITRSHDEKAILDACALCDEDTFYFHNANDGKARGCIYVLYGEGDTMITDYTDNTITNEIVDRAKKIAGIED